MYSLKEIAHIVQGKTFGNDSIIINHLYTDTRKIHERDHSIFIAINTTKTNGHRFVKQAINLGISAVIVTEKPNVDCAYILVKNSIKALQDLAIAHRKSFNKPVIGITGSNGKTIVKEWISHVLSSSFNICKNPKSYNSQIGVPLSIWKLNSSHTLGVFEAGISAYSEMDQLARIIQPNIGVFTYLGDAHGVNFNTQKDKLNEKIKLFEKCEVVICSNTQPEVVSAIRGSNISSFVWGYDSASDVSITKIVNNHFSVKYQKKECILKLPFSDKSSVHNAFTTLSIALYLGVDLEEIIRKIIVLPTIDMRLQQTDGIYNNQLILDYYNADYQSLVMAIDFLNQQRIEDQKCTIILSDIIESQYKGKSLYKKINSLLVGNNIDEVIGIGEHITLHENSFSLPSHFYLTTELFLTKYQMHTFKNQMILLKGARKYRFERIAEKLKLKTHQTALYVNLTRLQHNINIIKSSIKPPTKIMAMVKALAYGSGGYQIAKLLEFNAIDFLGVAYTDEATQLKESGINTPIMVLNPDLTDVSPYTNHTIQPVIYNYSSLLKIKNQSISVHIEFDTGMHRLGFQKEDIPKIVDFLKNQPNISVVSVFSHLSSADDSTQDTFTEQQIKLFREIAQKLENQLQLKLIKHILNTAGIERFSEASFDMVRLGIGLYGISPIERKSKLLPVSSFVTYISQIHSIPAGEGIGYGQIDKVNYPRKIAVIAVGYADGFTRFFGNGVGSVLIREKEVKVVGNVCMDMAFCDVTGVECLEGDTVVLFGDSPTVESLSKKIGTIPYEILTNISQRVNRVFFQE